MDFCRVVSANCGIEKRPLYFLVQIWGFRVWVTALAGFPNRVWFGGMDRKIFCVIKLQIASLHTFHCRICRVSSVYGPQSLVQRTTMRTASKTYCSERTNKNEPQIRTAAMFTQRRTTHYAAFGEQYYTSLRAVTAAYSRDKRTGPLQARQGPVS